jgi:hypothetical protein
MRKVWMVLRTNPLPPILGTACQDPKQGAKAKTLLGTNLHRGRCVIVNDQ